MSVERVERKDGSVVWRVRCGIGVHPSSGALAASPQDSAKSREFLVSTRDTWTTDEGLTAGGHSLRLPDSAQSRTGAATGRAP